MPRRSILTATERENLFGWPEAHAELIRHYTLSATDLAIIRQHRGAANRLGYAVQLCSMRHPGVALGTRENSFFPLPKIVAAQLKVPVERWSEYGVRAETRREHALELQTLFGFKTFTMRHYREGVQSLEDVAWQTDKGIVLASALVDEYCRQQVLLPTLNNIERICAEAITRANRRIYKRSGRPGDLGVLSKGHQLLFTLETVLPAPQLPAGWRHIQPKPTRITQAVNFSNCFCASYFGIRKRHHLPFATRKRNLPPAEK